MDSLYLLNSSCFWQCIHEYYLGFHSITSYILSVKMLVYILCKYSSEICVIKSLYLGKKQPIRHIYMDNIQCYSRMDTLIVIEHTKNNFLGLKNLCVILFCIKDSISIMTWIFLISHISDLSIKSHQANLSWNSPLYDCLFVFVLWIAINSILGTW